MPIGLSLNIFYFDLEVDPRTQKVLEYGSLVNGNQYRGRNKDKFRVLSETADTICGHNILAHDLPILRKQSFPASFFQKSKIDTLLLSVLLFPKKPYHHLVKDYHLEGTALNNPLADAKLTKELLADLLTAFYELPTPLKVIYYSLLRKKSGFDGFFKHVSKENLLAIDTKEEIVVYIKDHYAKLFCEKAALINFVEYNSTALAFAIAIITVDDTDSLLPSWVKHQFPATTEIINRLRVACLGNHGCPYCDQLSPVKGLKRFFGFEGFRSFDGDEGKPLQEKVVEAALANESFVAIFPTGGGKSLTFQLPALMKGVANNSLTVVISPLQSLMKDQVDVLRNRHGITAAVTINGMLSPLERSEAMEKVERGGANILYLSPESLRSSSIMRLLKNRVINRFVIDEAHCFSSWGQDFRVDYLYIGNFLNKLIKEKIGISRIPISCFTATAKLAVVEDIQTYFFKKLGLDLAVFQTHAKRKNLSYFVLNVKSKEEKVQKLIDLLRAEEGAKIVYVSRVKKSEELVAILKQNGIVSKAYHGRLERDEKISIQDEFMSNDQELEIIVATSAFGMGVDKDNVKVVIHYNISDSLENYVQESGRAGRKPALQAKCFILFDEQDLDAHFQLLNLTKLSHKEVYQVWQGIKEFKRKKFTKSALEIAKKAGWDTEMRDLETKIKVAIAALEETGYVKREENATSVFAQSILVGNVDEAVHKMDLEIHHFTGKRQRENAQRVIGSLISRAQAKEDTRVDRISESLAIERSEVTSILNVFKQIGILSDEKDLTAYYFTVQGKRNSQQVFAKVTKIEEAMFKLIFSSEHVTRKDIYLRELNEEISEQEVDCNLVVLKEILNYWADVNYIKKERIDKPNDQYRISLNMSFDRFKLSMGKRLEIAVYSLKVLSDVYLPIGKEEEHYKDRKLIEFSVLDLKVETEKLIGETLPTKFYEYILLYLHSLKVIELKDGLMIFYNPMKITRKIDNNKKRYTLTDYEKLAHYYESKTEQIHIVGEYAKKQLENNIAATQFVEDYFSLPFEGFLKRYFNQKKGVIRRTITEKKFNEIFSDLSTEQLNVVKDNHENILVAAGPGSGKTRVLVHKVASLLLIEDVKPEQFLMLTFSRPAALEFRNRLQQLVGNVAYQIDIFTYHGFAFQLMGKLGNLERSQIILTKVKEAIQEEEIPLDRIKNKSVVVVDEYQDVSQTEYDFLMSIVDSAEKIRVIAAGDDDQNIYEFRGSSVKYMRDFVTRQSAMMHYLTKNYRARHNLLSFSNLYLATQLSDERLKSNISLSPHKQVNGRIEIVKYQAKHLILPLIEQLVKEEIRGTVAVLTYKNEESILITSLLKQKGIPARLISDKQGFTLGNLLEIRTFTYFIYDGIQDDFGLITAENWKQQKEKILERYQHSENLELVQRIIDTFASTNPKKFRSAWNTYVRELRIEDFYPPEQNTILVSTMHKAKGKEFDHVFILLNNYPLTSEEKKRVLYVALTRAKDNLFIHTNNIDFPRTGIAALDYQENKENYPAPDTIILEAGMKDIQLGYFKASQTERRVKRLSSGMQLFPDVTQVAIFRDENQNRVLKLSQKFTKRLSAKLSQGYQLEKAYVKYIVVWYDEASGNSYRVVLPEIILKHETKG
ncbi:MAG: RecQ family ATP-dependent DNA helicase [Saprospiraceae bacterium]